MLASRRMFLGQFALGSLVTLSGRSAWADSAKPIAIGSRRELFLDDALLERLDGATLTLHKPVAKEVALVCDAAWEGNTSAYYTLFQDGDRYRAYYRGWHYDTAKKQPAHAEYTCYAESRDGLTFTKPELGLFDFQGSKANNIVWTGEGTHNFTPFKDAHPSAESTGRYKARADGRYTDAAGKQRRALFAFRSDDGLRWSKIRPEPVITDGAFDSQNLAFWDAERGEYRAYWRFFANKIRMIRTATSRDFLHWDHQADLEYGDAPAEHLYTNAIRPYFRAPHVFIGFPTRFQPAHQQVEPVFMSSRDGVHFRRWSEPVIPITAPQDRDGNRSNYMASGLLQLPGQNQELSVYATEAYYTGPGSRLRRFVYRTDGFVSARAEGDGVITTRPLTFTGSKLTLNHVSRGATRVELLDAAGQVLSGFDRASCVPLTGDQIDAPVSWRGADLGSLAGRAVRIRFLPQDADLFAFQFGA